MFSINRKDFAAILEKYSLSNQKKKEYIQRNIPLIKQLN